MISLLARAPHQQRRSFKARFKNQAWVLVEHDRENDSTYAKEIDAGQALELLDDACRKGGVILDRLETVEATTRALAEEWEWGTVLTSEAWKERRDDERRQALEGLARRIAKRHEVKPYTLEFIQKIEVEMDILRDYRTGMREDGLCMGYGVSQEQWFDEFNASQSDSETLCKLLEYVEEKAPLLWMQYQEAKAKAGLAD